MAQLPSHHFQSLKIITIVITVLGLLMMEWLSPAPALAQTNNAVEIQPTFQEILITEEQASASGQLQLTNFSQDTYQVTVTAADIKQFDANGQVILADKPLTGQDYSLAAFVDFPTPSQTLAADETLSIPFTIRNTSDLSPGGHYAALIVTLASPEGTSRQVVPALSSFVLVRKQGGEQFHMALQPVRWSFIQWSVPKQLEVVFNNQGNVHLTPRGTVTLTDMFGQLGAKGIINENSLFVLPQTQRQIKVEIDQVGWRWPIMFYTWSINGATQPAAIPFSQIQTVLVVEPIGLSLVLVVLISLTIFCFKKIRNKTTTRT